jgi:MFS family permease
VTRTGAWRRSSPALRFVLTVGAMSFFADFTYEGSRSVVGPYLGRLGAGALAISVVTGFGEFLGYGLRLVSGPAADRTGRYWPVTIAGYVLQMSVVPMLALAGSWPVAALLVVLERIGKAVRNPPRDAMLSHAASEIGYGRAFGLHEALDQFGATFGPLFVALVLLLLHHRYRPAFALLAAPAAVELALLGVARISYPRPAELERHPVENPGVGRPPQFWVYLGGAALVGAGFADFPLIAFHLQRDHVVSSTLVPVFYAVAMAVGGAGSLAFGRLYDRYGMRILVPLTAVAGVYAPLAFLGDLGGSLAGVLLWGIGVGVQESIVPAAVARLVGSSVRASAFGVFTGGYGIAWFAGSIVIGWLYEVSVPALVAFSMASQAAAIPMFLAAQRRAGRGSAGSPGAPDARH